VKTAIGAYTLSHFVIVSIFFYDIYWTISCSGQWPRAVHPSVFSRSYCCTQHWWYCGLSVRPSVCDEVYWG